MLLRILGGAIAASLLLVFWLLGLEAQLDNNSQTSDEAVHLAAGHRELLKRSRINPEHPPLAKLVAAVPVALGSYLLPEDGAAANEQEFQQGLMETERLLEEPSAQWRYGLTYLYETPLNWGPGMLRWGRSALAGLTTFLLLVGLTWMIGWSGPGALLAGAVLLTDPTLMAHSALVTNDALLAALCMLCLLGWISWLEKPELERAVMWGAYLSLALLTKFSALMLPPAMLAAGAGWVLCGGALPTRGRLLAGLGLGAAAATLPLFAFYTGGPIGYLIDYGTLQSSWSVYLLGALGSEGWYHYFAVALWAKLPPGSLLLFLALPVLLWRGPKLDGRQGALLAAAVVLFALPSLRRINIGIRHLLPLLPVVATLIGLRLASLDRDRKLGGRGVVLVTVLLVGLNTLALPRWWGHAIAYFNPVTVGEEGAEWLGDSNLDWGQGLVPLQQTLEAMGSPAILLGAFGNTPPEPWGIEGWQPLPASGHIGSDPQRVIPPTQETELLAVSEMTRLGVYFPPELRDLYSWLDAYEPISRPGGAYRLYDITDDPRAWTEIHRMYVRVGWAPLAELWQARIAARLGEDTSEDTSEDTPDRDVTPEGG